MDEKRNLKRIAEELASLTQQVDAYRAAFREQVEQLARLDRKAERERSIRVSPTGMYVRGEQGVYIGKDEADQALATIRRLDEKERRSSSQQELEYAREHSQDLHAREA